MNQLSKSEYEVLVNTYDHSNSYESCAAVAKIFQAFKLREWNSPQLKTNLFTVSVNTTIPKFAWICEVKNGNFIFTVGSGENLTKNPK